MPHKKTKNQSVRPFIEAMRKQLLRVAQHLRIQRSKSPYKSFQFFKKEHFPDDQRSIIPARRLFRQTLVSYRKEWKLFAGLSTIFLALQWIIVGLPGFQAYSELRTFLSDTLEGGANSLFGIGTLMMSTMNGLATGESSELQQFLGALVSVLFWMIYIYAIRHILADKSVTIREALYNASTPLIPLLIVIIIAVLQLIPGAIGTFIILYSLDTETFGISGVEAMLFSIAGVLMIMLSIYWLVQSLIALIIITLPNMYPLKALSSAKQLVKGRRGIILFRVVTLTLVAVLLWVMIILPLVYLDSTFISGGFSIVPFAIDIISAVFLPLGVIYLYRLYRELL